MSKLPQHINLVVVFIVVAIPEGLPMTVGISLAFSVMRMYKDGILIRKLEAPEQLGACDEILCGKTATLTQNDMKVSYMVLEGNKIQITRKDTFMNCELSDETIALVRNSILYNCSAQVEMIDTQYVPTGNGTEVGLLKFLQDADIPVHLLIQQKVGSVKAYVPFSSENKYSATAVHNPELPEEVTIYVKGAPEVIFDICSNTLQEAGIQSMDDYVDGANRGDQNY